MSETAETGFPVAASVAELLTTFAHDLAQGRYELDPGAAEEGHEFLVPVVYIDPGNYAQPGRWQHALLA